MLTDEPHARSLTLSVSCVSLRAGVLHLQGETQMKTRLHVNSGETFGRLTVVQEIGSQRPRQIECMCQCGTSTIVSLGNLRHGLTRSCGCLRRGTHLFLDYPSEYAIWSLMKQRCLNPSDRAYGYYGGRGIRVCDRWLHSFAAFLADMGRRPSKTHSIDRIDNDGNYDPGNCRWATWKQQHRNRRNNRLLTHDGQTLCVTEWSEVTGINAKVIFGRIYDGWSVEDTLTRPVR